MTGEDNQVSSSNLRPRVDSQHRESRTTDARTSPGSDRQSVGTEPSATSVVATPSTRRKRALSQNTDTAIARDRLLSTVSTNPVDSPGQICLCQPDPKVPRPRNAFILYRQHFQAKVVQENPGLANPEISKIIGDKWRNSPPETKAYWKGLAEEEKARHQRQYPDYRYQPKRGRNSVAAVVPAGQPSPRCHKCGGKSMATPTHMPSPGFRPSIAVPTESPNVSHYASHSAVMGVPRTPYGIPGGYGMSPIYASFNQRPLPHDVRPMDRVSPGDYPISPDTKRRRYDNPQNGIRYADHTRHMSRAIPSGGPHGIQSGSNGPGSDRLPRLELMKQSPVTGGFTISPAPPGPKSASHGHNNSQHDSLTLAPLKIKTPQDAAAAAKSVEAMVMSLKPLQKIRTLQRISMSLQKPGPTSPPQPVRGALVAIEYGDDRASGELIANAIRDDLVRNNEHITRAFDPPVLEHYAREAENSDVMNLMVHWHAVSKEIAKYMTTVPESAGDQPESPVSPKTVWVRSSTRRAKKRAAEGDAGAEKSDIAAADASITGAPENSLPTPEHPGPLPVALVPNYQLTATDRAACSVPINDKYSPLDHWQWVAALWRGTVAPDVIICIRGPNDADGLNSSPVAPGMKAKTAVEVRLEEFRTVIVRVDRKGEVSEQILRRVAFEVGEWVRGRESREG